MADPVLIDATNRAKARLAVDPNNWTAKDVRDLVRVITIAAEVTASATVSNAKRAASQEREARERLSKLLPQLPPAPKR